MKRAYYSDTIGAFVQADPDAIHGRLNNSAEGPVEQDQKDAWARQIEVMKAVLSGFEGKVYFEYAIPRMGKRIDVVLVLEGLFSSWSSRLVPSPMTPKVLIKYGIMRWI